MDNYLYGQDHYGNFRKFHENSSITEKTHIDPRELQ